MEASRRESRLVAADGRAAASSLPAQQQPLVEESQQRAFLGRTAHAYDRRVPEAAAGKTQLEGRGVRAIRSEHAAPERVWVRF